MRITPVILTTILSWRPKRGATPSRRSWRTTKPRVYYGVATLGYAASNYWNLGWPDAAIARAEEAVALARSERRMSSR
jgi:hypothetical protein